MEMSLWAPPPGARPRMGMNAVPRSLTSAARKGPMSPQVWNPTLYEVSTRHTSARFTRSSHTLWENTLNVLETKSS